MNNFMPVLTSTQQILKFTFFHTYTNIHIKTFILYRIFHNTRISERFLTFFCVILIEKMQHFPGHMWQVKTEKIGETNDCEKWNEPKRRKKTLKKWKEENYTETELKMKWFKWTTETVHNRCYVYSHWIGSSV